MFVIISSTWRCFVRQSYRRRNLLQSIWHYDRICHLRWLSSYRIMHCHHDKCPVLQCISNNHIAHNSPRNGSALQSVSHTWNSKLLLSAQFYLETGHSLQISAACHFVSRSHYDKWSCIVSINWSRGINWNFCGQTHNGCMKFGLCQ
jgi:hypothetical protein